MRHLVAELLNKGPRKIGKMFNISYNRFLLWCFHAEVGKNVQLFNRVYIDVAKGARLKIGDNFMMTSGGNFNPLCRNLRGSICLERPEAVVTIGEDTGMSSTCIWARQSITIGNRVKIGGNCIILDSDSHSLDYRVRASQEMVDGESLDVHSAKCAPIVIEDDVLIGTGCIILKGVTIGARSVVAAGSVVTRSIPSDCVAGGNPAKVIRHE